MSSSDAEPISGQLNLLVSYPYAVSSRAILDRIKQLGTRARFVLDSGAFTAWKLGRPIELDAYCKFIEALPVQPWRYFVLDMVGDPVGTLRNYEVMLARGFKPVPIYTRGEEVEQLDRYYETSDLVGIGGLVGTPNRLPYVYTLVKQNRGRRLDLLGFTGMEHLKALKPYMCDSNNWDASNRYGQADVYMGRGRFKRLSKLDARDKPSQEMIDRLRFLGFRSSELATRANWHGGTSLSRYICAASWVAASLDVERYLRTKLFLAFTTALALDALVRQYDRLCELQQPKGEPVEAI